MLMTLLTIGLGIFLGWMIPQPEWAEKYTDAVEKWWDNL